MNLAWRPREHLEACSRDPRNHDVCRLFRFPSLLLVILGVSDPEATLTITPALPVFFRTVPRHRPMRPTEHFTRATTPTHSPAAFARPLQVVRDHSCARHEGQTLPSCDNAMKDTAPNCPHDVQS